MQLHEQLTRIRKEIQTLRDERGEINRFLSSYEASKQPVLYNEYKERRTELNMHLNNLITLEIKLTEKQPKREPITIREKHIATPEQMEAIMLFNKDKNHKITE